MLIIAFLRYLKRNCYKYGSGHNPKFYNLEELTICSKGVLDYMHFMKYSCDELNPNACFSFYGLFEQWIQILFEGALVFIWGHPKCYKSMILFRQSKNDQVCILRIVFALNGCLCIEFWQFNAKVTMIQVLFIFGKLDVGCFYHFDWFARIPFSDFNQTFHF